MSLNLAVLSYELVDVRGWHCCITSRESVLFHTPCIVGVSTLLVAMYGVRVLRQLQIVCSLKKYSLLTSKLFNSQPYSYYAKVVSM